MLEFYGGPWDAKNLDSASEDFDQVAWVRDIRMLTKDCETGQSFQGLNFDIAAQIPPGYWSKLQPFHQYTVTDRLESDTEVLVRLTYACVAPTRTDTEA